MSDPDRDPDMKDYRWLVARERGEDIGHVLASDRAPYEQLGALLASGTAPGAGFRERVLAAIEAEERAANPAPIAEAVAEAAPAPAPEAPPAAPPAPEVQPAPPHLVVAPVVPIVPRKPWRRILIAGGLATAAAAAVVYFVIQPAPTPPGVIALATEHHPSPTAVRTMSDRADQANLGDTFVVRAETIGPAEVRVYGGSAGKLIAQCNDRGGCTGIERDGERRVYRLEMTLDLPGETRAVVFAGTNVPPTRDSYDQDLEAAAAARIKHAPSKPTFVR